MRFLCLAWTEQPSDPSINFLYRVGTTLQIFRHILLEPIWGIAHAVDELLYKKALAKIEVKAPLIELSAMRSGSTQVARYLEEDPSILAPSALQIRFPWIWCWRVCEFLARCLSIDSNWFIKQLQSAVPLEFLQRHEFNPMLTDTLEIFFLLSNGSALAFSLGPKVMLDEFAMASDHVQDMWQNDFVEFFDSIARKTLHEARRHNSPKCQLFIKGHFIKSAGALSVKYPDARFFTIIREPAPRFQSVLNFMRSLPCCMLPSLTSDSIPWPWLVQAFVTAEIAYCESERLWFAERPSGQTRKCVISFADYVAQLEGTMSKIYWDCLDIAVLPPHIPRTHTARDRSRYLLNRSLKELGVDETALNAHLQSYVAWCQRPSICHDERPPALRNVSSWVITQRTRHHEAYISARWNSER
jgi:hypothetical protein